MNKPPEYKFIDDDTRKVIRMLTESFDLLDDTYRRIEKKFMAIDGSVPAVKTDMSLINTFPNVLLLDRTSDSDDSSEECESDEEDIWNILSMVSNQTASETLSDIETPTCKSCGSTEKLVEDRQTFALICPECAVVVEETMDQGPEWRQYNNEESSNDSSGRCGCPSNPFFPKSSQGTILSGPVSNRMKQKQIWDASHHQEKSIGEVFQIINKICKKNKIPMFIADCANGLYQKVYNSKYLNSEGTLKNIITRGKNRTSIIAACLMKACYINNYPIENKKVAAYFEITRKKLTSGSRILTELIKKSDDKYITVEKLEGMGTDDYIRSICPKLGFGKKIIDLAIQISNNCYKLKLISNHNPKSIAAGTVCLASQFSKTHIVSSKKIASYFNTSEVTVNKIKKKISQYTAALIDDDATDFLVERFEISG